MAGVSNLFQRMTQRKTSGFNVWQINENEKSLRETKRPIIGQVAAVRKENKTPALETNPNVATNSTYASYIANLNCSPNDVYPNNGNNNNPSAGTKTISSDNKTKVNSSSKTIQRHAAASSLAVKGRELKSQQVASSQTLPPGNLIGNYVLGRTLGRGTFAKVKLAKHMPTGKEVAIKIIDKTQLSDSDLIKVYREIRIMKILNHPNIVRLYEVIEAEKYLHLVLEYVPKGEIFDFVVKNGRLQETEARNKFRQIISAIEYCHRKFIVHRDLKVENLLLDNQMGIKICDFGFSNEFSNNGKLNTFCGSPPYAAPELFLGKNYIGPEVDVWSLGVVLYTLLCGALPFDGRSVKELKQGIMKGAYHVPSYLSQQSRDMIKKFLCVMPSRRITLQAAMNESWLNLGHELNPLRPFHEEEEPVDTNKIEQMVKQGYYKEMLMNSVRGEKFDELYATYKLTTPQNSEKQSITRMESSASFLSTPLRRSLREHNNNNTNNNNNDENSKIINSTLSMRIPPPQNHVMSAAYQSTSFSDQKAVTQRTNSAVGARGSNNNISGEVMMRKNAPGPETKYKRVTTSLIAAKSPPQKLNVSLSISRNGINNESTSRNSFKGNQSISSSNSNNHPEQKKIRQSTQI